MKRPLVVAVAAIACMAIVSVTAASAASIGSAISLSVTPASVTPPSSGPYGQVAGAFSGSLNGKVSAKGRCHRNRLVKFRFNGTPIGSTKTDKKGNYTFPLNVQPPGTIIAKAKKKTIVAGGNSFLCKASKASAGV